MVGPAVGEVVGPAVGDTVGLFVSKQLQQLFSDSVDEHF